METKDGDFCCLRKALSLRSSALFRYKARQQVTGGVNGVPALGDRHQHGVRTGDNFLTVRINVV